tara:strand:+ start:1954 stop:3642 length:1689 start_codon:yes stop_codon:yes gene_type:complete
MTSNEAERMNKELITLLFKRIPPKNYCDELKDIIDALMEALDRGEIEIALNKKSIPKNLRINNWPKAHISYLNKSDWINNSDSPIVITDKNLRWKRWHIEISDIIRHLEERNKAYKNDNIDPCSIAISRNKECSDQQNIAINSIAKNGLIILSGGPGTGKTRTIVKIIEKALIINPKLAIGLAAPTGKATKRLQEGLVLNTKHIEANDQNQFTTIQCKTLHKWLEATPEGFTNNKNKQINVDLFIIDEMSMVDILMIKSVLLSLPKETQLVLVGDPNQLAPIGSGSLWNELHKAHILKKFKEAFFPLNHVYRNRGEIAHMSKILCEYGMGNFWKDIYQLPKSSNIKVHQSNYNSLPELLLERINTHKKFLTAEAKKYSILHENSILSHSDLEAKKLLSYLDTLLVLCPQKKTNWGVNQIHRFFLGNNYHMGPIYWEIGTPVLCTENQTDVGLSNGDLGIIILEEGNKKILFNAFSGKRNNSTKIFNPIRIKGIEPAFGITIHKSQGSEASEVAVLWPHDPIINFSPQKVDLNRNEDYEQRLLYTAITRAKNKVDIFVKHVFK